jgi:hypothetical protein
MSRESDIDALRFTETIPPLALAPLARLAVLGPADGSRGSTRRRQRRIPSASEPLPQPRRLGENCVPSFSIRTRRPPAAIQSARIRGSDCTR